MGYIKITIGTESLDLLLKHKLLTEYENSDDRVCRYKLTPSVRRKMLDLGEIRYKYDQHRVQEETRILENEKTETEKTVELSKIEKKLNKTESKYGHSPKRAWKDINMTEVKE